MSILKSAVLVILSSCMAGAQTYRVANLGTLGGHWSSPAAVNNLGHVAGTARLASGTGHPFLWNNVSGMQDLDPVASDTSGAYGINNSDQVVGGDTNSQHAFLWTQSAGMQDIGTLGGCCSDAFAINDRSMIVGWSETTSGVGEAFSWTQFGGMQALLTGNGRFSNTQAYALNNAGVIVGAGDVVSSALTQHALMWTTNGGVTDLGSLGGMDSVALGVNASNQVVGWSLTAGGATHPFLWSRTAGMQDLGIMGGFYACVATGINNQGVVVGTCFANNVTQMPHAFVWTSSGGMRDLNNHVIKNNNGTLGEAVAINAHGQIVVWAASSAYFKPSRAVLLTPQ